MHPADIKAAIAKAGSSQREIAHECGVTPSTVAHVIHGRGISVKVALTVAHITGLDLATLWPSKYGDKPVKAAPQPKKVVRRHRTLLAEQVA